MLSCKFSAPPTFTITPPASSGAEETEYDLGAVEYHLLVARGNPSGENLAYHTVGRRGSGESTSLKSFKDLAGGSTGIVRAHGIIMILAWLACAPTGN